MRIWNRTASVAALAAMLSAATASSAAPTSAQSKDCWAKADQQHLAGKDRADFHANCVKGAAVPPGPTAPARGGTPWANAVTAPSGQDRAARSKLCSGEADHRGLVGGKRESFRLACLATAGPVAKVGSNTHQPGASGQKPDIDRAPPAAPN